MLAMAAVVAVASAALAVEISLSSNDVDRIGATPQVDVLCPANLCQVTRVRWVITSSYPYQVDQVRVQWTPATTNNYNVYVTLFDSDSSAISGGATTVSVSGGSPTDTWVDVSDVDPGQVYKIQIVIVEATS
ncbi:MAG: hypothetical protein QXJ49_02905 [Nitrososphaerota archaeon]